MPVVDLRHRRTTDIPALASVLLEQQATSRYPFRDPLPISVERFLHADEAVSAWTAELDGRPVGHVCFTHSRADFPGAAEMDYACAAAHGCAVDELAWISALFVGLGARGAGTGRRLLSAVVEDIRAAALRPCLEVLPVHPGAMSLYVGTGWREVMRLRPEWLRAAVGDDGPDVTVMVLTRPS